MNLFKKIMPVALACSLLAACGSSTAATETVTEETAAPEETAVVETEEPVIASDPVDVRVTAMKGPTAMGMVSLMNQVDNGEITSNNYSFELLSSTDEITPKIVQGEVDIAAVPANLASVLYNKTEGDVEVLAVNTLGVLYIVSTNEVDEDATLYETLGGKTIYASGQGASPEYALNYILTHNGLNPETDVVIEWKSEHSEVVSALAQDPDAYALLPQPFVTVAQTNNEAIQITYDLTEEWNKIQADEENPSQLITGVVIARKEFVEENPEAVEDFLALYEESINFTLNNTDEAAALIGSYDIVAEGVAKKALPYCNITYIDGNEMKTALSGYLQVLYDSNPSSVGGALPEDDFYYGAE